MLKHIEAIVNTFCHADDVEDSKGMKYRVEWALRYLNSHPLFQGEGTVPSQMAKLAIPMLVFNFKYGLHQDIPVERYVDQLVEWLRGMFDNKVANPDGTWTVSLGPAEGFEHVDDANPEVSIMASLAKYFDQVIVKQ